MGYVGSLFEPPLRCPHGILLLNEEDRRAGLAWGCWSCRPYQHSAAEVETLAIADPILLSAPDTGCFPGSRAQSRRHKNAHPREIGTTISEKQNKRPLRSRRSRRPPTPFVPLSSRNTTGYRGVSLQKNGRYRAAYKRTAPGGHEATFATALEAALAYDSWADGDGNPGTTNRMRGLLPSDRT